MLFVCRLCGISELKKASAGGICSQCLEIIKATRIMRRP